MTQAPNTINQTSLSPIGDSRVLKLKRYPMPLPFGWFSVAYSEELPKQHSMPLRFFNHDMVIFRTESGKAVVLDAYCPHLGAHLGYGIHESSGGGGKVQGETITCPFHAWRFDEQGKCVEVPYAKNMPPKVKNEPCLRAWDVQEINGSIYVWYHPQQEAPKWDLEFIPEANSDEWGEPQRFEWILRAHPQEMSENAADPAHFLFVHRTETMPKWNITYENHLAKGLQEAKMKTPKGTVDGAIRTYSKGPGDSTTRFTGICETLLIGMTTPIDDEYVRIRFSFIQKKGDSNSGVGKAIIKDICRQVQEDAPIWEHKIYRRLPILCDGDGPIAKFRKWYGQFYADFDGGAM